LAGTLYTLAVHRRSLEENEFAAYSMRSHRLSPSRIRDGEKADLEPARVRIINRRRRRRRRRRRLPFLHRLPQRFLDSPARDEARESDRK